LTAAVCAHSPNGIYFASASVSAAAGSSSQADEIPSILSDEFEAWSKIAGNFERWEKSLETMGN
jgi:hypothetical protein